MRRWWGWVREADLFQFNGLSGRHLEYGLQELISQIIMRSRLIIVQWDNPGGLVCFLSHSCRSGVGLAMSD